MRNNPFPPNIEILVPSLSLKVRFPFPPVYLLLSKLCEYGRGREIICKSLEPRRLAIRSPDSDYKMARQKDHGFFAINSIIREKGNYSILGFYNSWVFLVLHHMIVGFTVFCTLYLVSPVLRIKPNSYYLQFFTVRLV